MSNKTDLQRNNVILSNSADGLLGGLSKVRNALQDKNVTVPQSGKTPTFDELRDAIETGVTDLSDTTAQANDVATGKVFYDKDGKKTEGSGKLAKELTGFDEIDLQEFAISTIYSFYSSKGELFISSSNDSKNTRGIFRYDKGSKSFKKVISDSNGYGYNVWFESSDGRIFTFAGNYGEPIHYYNEDSDEFIKLNMKASVNGGSFTELNDGTICMVGGQAGLCVIRKDNSVLEIRTSELWGTTYLYYDTFHDEFFFKSNTTGNIYRINDTRDDAIQLPELNSTSTPNFWAASEDYLFMNIGKTGGQYYFDFLEKKFISFSDTNGTWGSNAWNIVPTSKGCFISNAYSANGALYLYNNGTGSVIDIGNNNYKWSIFECSNGLIIGGNSNFATLYKYDESTNTMIEINESINYCQRYTDTYFEHDNYVYFSSGLSSYYGTYRFNINTLVFERVSYSASIRKSTYPQKQPNSFIDSYNNLYLPLIGTNEAYNGYIIRKNSEEESFSIITIKYCDCGYISQIDDSHLFISSTESSSNRWGSVIYSIIDNTSVLLNRKSLYIKDGKFYEYNTGKNYYELSNDLTKFNKIGITPNFGKFLLSIGYQSSYNQSILCYDDAFAVLNGVYTTTKNTHAIDIFNGYILILNEE